MGYESRRKKELLKDQMITFIMVMLEQAEKDNKLDYFEIKINNHNGSLQQDCTFKRKEKAY